MPPLARRNYGLEITAAFLFSAALAVVEGGVASVIVKNTYAGVVGDRLLNFVVAFVTAAPEAANLTSYLWAAAAHGRPKVRFINALQVGVVAMVLATAFAPRTEAGLIVLATAVGAARAFMAGVFTLRATVWRANYARRDRARATGKFSTIQVIVVAFVGFALGRTLDASDNATWYTIPALCLLGLAGAAVYGRIRVRGHRALLALERNHLEDERITVNPLSLWRVLSADRNYAWFQLWLFILGAGNLMLTAPLAITLREQFGQKFAGGIAIITTIPYVVMVAAIPLWARLLARSHVVRFRAYHTWAAVIAQSLVFIGVQVHQLWIIALGMGVMGVMLGGGALAWNLGHLDFAPRGRASQYMGVHVTLNGVRGAAASFVAVAIYEWLEASQPGAGRWVFAVSVVLCVIGSIGFVSLYRSMGEAARTPPREA